MITVLPIFFQERIIFLKSHVDLESRLDEGLSRSKISGKQAEIEAHAIFCFSPPDNLKMLLFKRVSIWKSETTLLILLSISSTGNPKFSHPKVNSLVVSTLKNYIKISILN